MLGQVHRKLVNVHAQCMLILGSVFIACGYLVLPPFLNISIFRDFYMNYIRMYIDIF